MSAIWQAHGVQVFAEAREGADVEFIDCESSERAEILAALLNREGVEPLYDEPYGDDDDTLDARTEGS